MPLPRGFLTDDPNGTTTHVVGALTTDNGLTEVVSQRGIAGNQTITLTLPSAGVFLLSCHGTGGNIEDFHTHIIQWNGNPLIQPVIASLIDGNYNQSVDNPPGHLTISYLSSSGYAPGGSTARPGYNSGNNSNQLQIIADSSISSFSYSLVRLISNL